MSEPKVFKITEAWFISQNTYIRSMHSFTYYYQRVMALVGVCGLLAIPYAVYMFVLYHEEPCHPAFTEQTWIENGCEEIIGDTWENYAWPARY